MLVPTTIEATTIADAWFQALSRLWKGRSGKAPGIREYVVQTGSDAGQVRVEFDFIAIHILHPGVRPLLPQMPEGSGLPPVADEQYLAGYMAYLLSPEKAVNEHYTYGERLAEQFEFVTAYYRAHGPDTNRMCMEIAKPDDIFFYRSEGGSSPCLRTIDTRIMDGKLHWIVYFRSWNLWSGFPVNLAGLQQAKEIMAMEIGVDDGEIVAVSKGLNIRGYQLEVARSRLRQ